MVGFVGHQWRRRRQVWHPRSPGHSRALFFAAVDTLGCRTYDHNRVEAHCVSSNPCLLLVILPANSLWRVQRRAVIRLVKQRNQFGTLSALCIGISVSDRTDRGVVNTPGWLLLNNGFAIVLFCASSIKITSHYCLLPFRRVSSAPEARLLPFTEHERAAARLHVATTRQGTSDLCCAIYYSIPFEILAYRTIPDKHSQQCRNRSAVSVDPLNPPIIVS